MGQVSTGVERMCGALGLVLAARDAVNSLERGVGYIGLQAQLLILALCCVDVWEGKEM
jgi:hypothetical protein